MSNVQPHHNNPAPPETPRLILILVGSAAAFGVVWRLTGSPEAAAAIAAAVLSLKPTRKSP